MDNFIVLVLLCASIGLANGALWCLVPTIISERFGMKYFGVNWGCTLLASALIGVGFQRAFGALYDEFVFRPIETLLCQGNDCFRYSFVLFSIFTICSMILIAIFLSYRQRTTMSYDDGGVDKLRHFSVFFKTLRVLCKA